MKLPYRGSGKVYIRAKEYQCDLYYSESLGGIVIKIKVIHENPIGNFLELPLEIPYLTGQLDSGFQFSLLHLNRTGMQDLITSGVSIYTFSADYILGGIGEGIQSEQTFHKVQYVLSNIVEWGEESAYTIGETFELSSKSENIEKLIYTGQGLTIKYLVRGSSLPIVEQELLTERICLEQHGIIEISLENEERFQYFNYIFERLKRLIEIASLRRINVEKVYAYSCNILYTIGDKTIERALDIYGKNIQENKTDKIPQSRPWKWVSLQELIDQNSFAFYFDKHEKLAPIIELFLEPFYVENSSKTRVFLNVVQALETYHSRFITNSLEEFKLRVESLTNHLPERTSEECKKYLLAKSKKFITLESRIADLVLANWNIYFDTGEIEHGEFPSVIAHSRNYYIHYDESIKEKHRVLTEEELQFYNRSLIQILEYYILLELGFSENNGKLKEKLINRWGNVSQDLEILRVSRSQ